MEQLDLSAFFKTKAQASDFKVRLSSISERVYQTNFHLENVLMEEFGLQKRDAFMAVIRENNISVESPKDIKAFFDSLLDMVSTFPVLALTIAFEPKESTLKAISQWFLLNIKKQVLLDITVDPKIIAGALVSFEGKYIDGSVKEKFVKVVQQAITHQTAPAPQASPPPPPNHQTLETISLGR